MLPRSELNSVPERFWVDPVLSGEVADWLSVGVVDPKQTHEVSVEFGRGVRVSLEHVSVDVAVHRVVDTGAPFEVRCVVVDRVVVQVSTVGARRSGRLGSDECFQHQDVNPKGGPVQGDLEVAVPKDWVEQTGFAAQAISTALGVEAANSPVAADLVAFVPRDGLPLFHVPDVSRLQEVG